uniref:Ig-like domain-containing protein n=1 Tax=Molossus molossus TaxID=27622 RepID=A0A7J8CWK5_MOLMO|nr:hypothetical protein HJG59_002445 [Molossus molossus]
MFSDQLSEQQAAEAGQEAETCWGKQRRGRGSSLQPQAGYSEKGHPEGRAMWLPSALLLLCVPGSWSLSGPSEVAGPVGGSLSVQCRYSKEYEAFVKYWCRQPCLPIFSEVVKTSASRGEVRSGRVSIADQPGSLTFTVTLRNLTASDAGKYRCGISTLLLDDGISGFLPEPFVQVQVLVTPASDPCAGPRETRHLEPWPWFGFVCGPRKAPGKALNPLPGLCLPGVVWLPPAPVPAPSDTLDEAGESPANPWT